MTLLVFGGGVIADVISSKEVNRVGRAQCDWCLCKKGKLGPRDANTGRTPCEDDRRDGVMNLQAKQCQGLSQTTRMQGRPGADPPSQPSGGTNPATP